MTGIRGFEIDKESYTNEEIIAINSVIRIALVSGCDNIAGNLIRKFGNPYLEYHITVDDINIVNNKYNELDGIDNEACQGYYDTVKQLIREN